MPGLVRQRADIDAALFSEATSRGEQKMSPIRQELRPAMGSFLFGAIQFRHGRGGAASRGNLVDRAKAGPEQDRVVGTPRGAPRLTPASFSRAG